MKKVIIITDSVSMPRPGISYEDTWIYLFKKRFPMFDVIDRPERGSTSMRLSTEGGGGVDLLETYNPDLAIIQIGITECAPRFFKKKGIESFFIKKLIPKKYIPKYIAYVKKTRDRNPNLTDVSPEDFQRNIYSYAKRCQKIGTKLLIVKILKPTSMYIKKSKFIEQNINKYNLIYKKTAEIFPNVTVIDPIGDDFDIDSLCLDELHINARGHIIYSNSINLAVSKLIYGCYDS